MKTSPRDAAAVIMVRRDGADLEVFWVRRGRDVSFSSGFHAFVGGVVDPADEDVPMLGCFSGDRRWRVCAVRETFEESGVLVARGAAALSARRLRALRGELLDGADFAELLRGTGVRLDGGMLQAAGRWVTPPFSSLRFDARFYLAVVPAGTEATVISGELSEGEWVRPADALRRWETGEVLLHPPTHHALATLAGYPPEAAISRLRSPKHVSADNIAEHIEFQRGVILACMDTRADGERRWSHAWVVGTGELVVIDPRPSAELEALLARLAGEGRELKAALLTMPSAGGREASAALGIPVRELADGEVMLVGGPRPMRLCCLRQGAVCVYLAEDSGAAFTGRAVGPVPLPEGEQEARAALLRSLLSHRVRVLYPRHGYVVHDGRAHIEDLLGA